MLLSKILEGIQTHNEFKDVEIREIKRNAATVQKGDLFVCMKGTKADGHDFAEKALKNGAAAIVCQRDLLLANQVLVADSREAYALMSANYFENPAKKMKLVAVTGTNGKTSTATVIKRVLCENQGAAGLISTIEAQYGEQIQELENTTPNAFELHGLLRKMADQNIEFVSMEASSHALDQKRLMGLHFNVAVFTNLTQDHLDYHKNMVEYYKAKKKLFDMCDCGIINIDDKYGKKLFDEITCTKYSYSLKDETADYFARDIEISEEGVRFFLKHGDLSTKITFCIPGIYSVQNALAAAAACMELGLSQDRVSKAISSCDSIRGRCELIKAGQQFHVICDYAHTPDGLCNLLKSVKTFAKGKVTLLFGCGGDRDKTKRPLMGQIAAKYADFIIVTSDNPRTENPKAIIGDILRGIPADKPHICIVERNEAIRYALLTARKGDTVILAGKGHENYQVLGDKRIYFDERKLAYGILHTYTKR